MYGNLPKEVLAEILIFISEREHFESIREFGAVSQRQLTSALQDLAHEMLREVEKEKSQEADQVLQGMRKPYKKLIEKLSRTELDLLLKGFFN